MITRLNMLIRRLVLMMMSNDKPPFHDERYRIHFLHSIEDLDSGYKCLKCGFIAVTRQQMYDHRKGLLSQCFKKRLFNQFEKWSFWR